MPIKNSSIFHQFLMFYIFSKTHTNIYRYIDIYVYRGRLDSTNTLQKTNNKKNY